MVAAVGHAWLLGGVCVVGSEGMHGCSGGACVVALGGMCGIRQDTEIRSMSGRYASYWNAFLLMLLLVVHKTILLSFKPIVLLKQLGN